MKKFLLTSVFVFIGSLAFAQERIAVFPFEDMENVLTRNESVMFYREFSNEFTNRSAGKFSVVPRQEVERLINTEAAFQLSDFSARAKTAEMQRVLNGTQILSGLIGKLNNNIRITVSLYTYPELVQLPGGVTLSVANKNELFSKIPELVQSMQNIITGGGREQSIPEGLMYEIVDNKTVTITDYIGNAATVNIPSQIDGLLVTSIGDFVFTNNGSLTSINIPASVTFIGIGAFSNCSSLTSVTIPASVTFIGDSAFSLCRSLTSITVDNRNPVYTSIDGVLFDKNIRTLIQYPIGRNQRTYIIPSSVTSIGKDAFALCDNLTSVTIPSSVTFIGEGAFGSFNGLTSLAVDNRNPAYASIDGVLFDKNIRTLIQYPIGRNQGTYVIPSSVTSIGKYAFNGSRLTSVTIPSSVISIGKGAFNACSSLTSVTIPASVTSIGENTFSQCYSLTSFTVDNRNPVFTSVDGVIYDKNIRTLIQYPVGKNQGTYVIPFSVTSIKNSAFFACFNLTSVTIPPSVTSIGSYTFINCQNLTSVSLSRRTQVEEYAFPETTRITYRD